MSSGASGLVSDLRTKLIPKKKGLEMPPNPLKFLVGRGGIEPPTRLKYKATDLFFPLTQPEGLNPLFSKFLIS